MKRIEADFIHTHPARLIGGVVGRNQDPNVKCLISEICISNKILVIP